MHVFLVFGILEIALIPAPMAKASPEKYVPQTLICRRPQDHVNAAEWHGYAFPKKTCRGCST
jgi:hypothetical protein